MAPGLAYLHDVKEIFIYFYFFLFWPRLAACGISVLQSESESCSVVSDSLQPHWYCPWNPPGQNAGVGSLSLLQGIFLTQGSNPGLLHCRQMLYPLSHQGSPGKFYVINLKVYITVITFSSFPWFFCPLWNGTIFAICPWTLDKW